MGDLLHKIKYPDAALEIQEAASQKVSIWLAPAGEPLQNLGAVLPACSIMTDPRPHGLRLSASKVRASSMIAGGILRLV